MVVEFYGAKKEAQEEINRLLQLPSTGREQDWEIEFSDYSRVEEMLGLLEKEDLCLDLRCALALLIICSIDDADDFESIDYSTVGRVADWLSMDYAVRERMEFFWIELNRATNINLVRKLIAI